MYFEGSVNPRDVVQVKQLSIDVNVDASSKNKKKRTAGPPLTPPNGRGTSKFSNLSVACILRIMASSVRTSAENVLAQLYRDVRARTMQIVAPLEIEDYVIQTAEYMSPPRWHIGHTSWFFETLLQKYKPGYNVYSSDFLYYFNSYYEGFGARIERPKRGTKSRPTVRATVAYRNHVDEQMLAFLDSIDDKADEIRSLVRLGLEHEMQHQELLVYDIKHLLGDQFDAPINAAPKASAKVEGMAEIEGGLFWLGYGSKVQSPKSKVEVN